LIESVLGCRLFEHYGSREFGMIAAECEHHQGLHMNPLAAYVEGISLSGTGPGELQEILVTDLLNYGMPLIRYRVNDCAVLETGLCSCGRGYPMIQEITGRTTDVFRLGNGDAVPGVALTNRVLQTCPALRKVQVIQETIENFRVRYVAGSDCTPAVLDGLLINLRNFIPHPAKWTFERVTDIEREPSGKTRFCISRVTEDVSSRTGGPQAKFGTNFLNSGQAEEARFVRQS
jgi:phenylacetate-CoA ligase